jgi:hypothetical protein
MGPEGRRLIRREVVLKMGDQLAEKLQSAYNLVMTTAAAIWQCMRERKEKWEEVIQHEGEPARRLKEAFDRLFEDIDYHFDVIRSNVWWAGRWDLNILSKYPKLRRKALLKLSEAANEMEELKKKIIFLFDFHPLRDLETERDTAISNLTHAESIISEAYSAIENLEKSKTQSNPIKEAIEAIRALRGK